MDNVVFTVKGNTLTITVDLSQRLGTSTSGKSTTVASTRGNAKVPGSPVVVGLNVYVPVGK